MKFLQRTSQTDKNRLGRRVFFADSLEGTDTGPSSLSEALEHPYRFRPDHIKEMENNRGSLEAKDLRKFNQMAEYYVSLMAEEGTDSVLPTRITIELYNSPLFTYLNSYLQRRIEHLFNKKREQFIKSANVPTSSQTDVDVMRVTRLYNFMKTRAAKYEDQELQKALPDVSSKLIARVKDLMVGYRVVRGSNRVEPINPESTPKLKYSERFLILEVYRLFPDEQYWLEGKKAVSTDDEEEEGTKSNQKEKIRLMAEDSLRWVIEEMTKDDAESRNSALLVMFWDFLDMWLESYETSGSALGITGDQKIVIQRMVERGNMAQFLSWAKSWLYADNKVLLPSHIRALREIQSQKYQPLGPDDVRKDLEALESGSDEDEQVSELQKEIDALQEKIEDERSRTVGQIIAGGKLKESEKGAELEIRYQELLGKIGVAREKYLDPSIHTAITSIEAEFNDWKSKATIVTHDASTGVSIDTYKAILAKDVNLEISTLEGDFPSGKLDALKPGGELSEDERKQVEYYSLLRDAGNDRIARYEGALSDIIGEYKSARETEKRKGVGSADDALVKTYNDRIQEYQTQLENFRKIKQKWQKELDLVEKLDDQMKRLQEEIQSQVGASESKEQKNLQKKLQELRSKNGLSDREKQVLQDRYNMFEDPETNAKEILDRYNRGLSKRSREGGLYAADIAVLFYDEDEGLSGDDAIGGSVDILTEVTGDEADVEKEAFKAEFKTRLTKFRQDFNEVLEESITTATKETLGIPDPVRISGGDRFSVWNRALDRLLSYGNLLPQLQEKGGLDEYVDFYREREQEVNIAELIDGAVLGSKNKIISLVEDHHDVFGFSGSDDPLLKEFLAQYPRFHTTLALSDRYKRLQEKREEFARQKAEINRESEAVLNKVDLLFGEGSWDQIWKLIHPYIKPPEAGVTEKENEHTIRAQFFSVFDEAGDLIDGTRYLEYDHNNPPSEENSGRWHGSKARVAQLLESYCRDEVDPVLRQDIAEKVLKMGLSIKGKEEVSQVILEQREALIGGENSQLPGKETLAEAEIQLYPIRDAISQEVSTFVEHLRDIEKAFQSNSSNAELELRGFLLEGQKSLIPSINAHLDSAKGLLYHVIPGKKEFVDAYIQNLESDVRLIASRIAHFSTELAAGNVATNHPLFERIPAMFIQLDKSFSVTEGVWMDHLNVVKAQQDKIPETVQILKDDFGLYGPDAENEAKTRYQKFRKEYSECFVNYRKNYGMVKNTVNQDIKAVEKGKMKREEFSLIHGSQPEELQEMLRNLDADYTEFEGNWDYYGDEKFFDRWLDRYRNPDTRQGAMREFGVWGDIKTLAGELKEGNQRFVSWKGDYDEYKKNMQNMNGGYEFRMISLNAIFQMCKDSFELAGRRIERRIERDKAFLGSAIFGEKGMFGLGYEWERKRTEDEEKRVEEFKNQYKRKNMWEKRAMLYRLGEDAADKDEVRALVDLLVDDGTMRWDDPLFWKVLNRLNKNNGPQISAGLIDKPMGEIKIVLRQSCGALWDDYVFKNWDDSIDGNHQKAVDAVKKEFADMEAMGGREKVLAQMLEKWKRGEEDETVSPERFEGLLKAAYDAGKLNGTPDPRWFYLIMGMTVKNGKTGMTLISRTMLDRLDESLLSRMPYFDFFTDKVTPKKDGWIVSPDTPGAQIGPWTMQDIMKWGDFFGANGRYGFNHTNDPTILRKCNEFFYNNVVESDNALMRVDRMARAGIKEADHDDGEMWFAGMSMQAFQQMLNRTSDRTDKISPDLAATIVNGFGHYMRATYEFIKSGDEVHGNNEHWQAQKQKRLTRAAELMRVAFAGFHTLAGNYHGTAGTEPQTLARRFWKEDLYGIKKNQARVNGVIRKMLEYSQADLTEYEEVWSSRCCQDVSENYADRVKDSKYKRVNSLVAKVLSGGDAEEGQVGVSAMFNDLDLVQRVIMEYGNQNGGITSDSGQANTSLLYKEDTTGSRLLIDY